MAAADSLLLDGLELMQTSGPLGVLADGLLMPTPPPRPEWVSAADSEGAALVRAPLFDNREITIKVAVTQTTMDLLLAQVGAVVDKLQKAAKYPDGIPLVWTPGGGTKSATFDVLAGEIVDLPLDWASGWLALAPEITIKLTCKPHWRGTPLTSFLDDFSVDSIAAGAWTFDSGSGSIAVSGGALVPSSTAEKRLYHSGSPYDLSDSQVTLKYTTGATIGAGSQAGIVLKRVDATNYLVVRLSSTTAIALQKHDVSTFTTLGSFLTISAIATATTYWLRARIEGNTIYFEHWTSAPSITGTPAASTSYTLTGADATQFGYGVTGRAGLRLIPPSTDWTYDDFRVDPFTYASSTPAVTGVVAKVGGDVPALGILTVWDAAGQPRRHGEYGAEGPLTLDQTTALILDSDSLVTSGFAGVQATLTGAYDPNASGNNAISLAAQTFPQAMCGTGAQGHIGTYRVKARVNSGTGGSDATYRFSYRVGDGVYATNTTDQAEIVTTTQDFYEIDLGTITIPRVLAGTQRWDGRVEAWAAVAGETIFLDYLILVPVNDGYGKARAVYSYSPGVGTGFDDFAGTTAGSNLNARTAPTGGAWATSGATTDFAFADDLSGEQVKRATVSDAGARFAILGSATPTDSQVEASVYRTSHPFGAATLERGLIARWTDASNYVRGSLIYTGGTTVARSLTITQRVAGTDTVLASVPLTGGVVNDGAWYSLRMIVFASGRVLLFLLNQAKTNILATAEGSSSALATGGALASGKAGLYDINADSTAATRYYDDFLAATPASEPIAIYSGRSIQFRYDDTVRDDSGGTYLGRPQSYKGSRFLLQPGDTRVLAKARRNDVEATTNSNVTDATVMQISYTPRGLAVPR